MVNVGLREFAASVNIFDEVTHVKSNLYRRVVPWAHRMWW